MTTAPTEQSTAFNWLEAISGDNGNFDPRYASMHPYASAYINNMERTYQVHQAKIPHNLAHSTISNPLFSRAAEREHYTRRIPKDMNREDEIHQKSRLDHWVETTTFFAETTGLESPEEDCMETKSNSSTETYFDALDTALNLEAQPPFPTSAPGMSYQWASHNHIYQGSATPSSPLFKTEEGTQEPSEQISDTNSCDNALLPFCQPLRRATSLAASNAVDHTQACEPQWLIPLAGRVITNKARGAIRKLRRKLSGDGHPQDGH
ncbi:hypothetical protein N7541_002162 [Penicillium brevicompactum]|uniref:Uncharacterized protein n=1 Tax=Penicillium brevicompactum TaxID=5074 RepID=A0A9W9RPB8_PENBR|nr:hypothetical protein N7541_002162 [Penicillium brevicompactum]